MQVALVPLGLVSMQVLLISHSTHSAKLLFFQKAMPVIMIVNFACVQGYEEWRKGAYARNRLNVRANAPSPLLSENSVQKGACISGAYGNGVPA